MCYIQTKKDYAYPTHTTPHEVKTSVGDAVTSVGHAGSVGFLGLSLGFYTVTTTCPVRPGSVLYIMVYMCYIQTKKNYTYPTHTTPHEVKHCEFLPVAPPDAIIIQSQCKVLCGI